MKEIWHNLDSLSKNKELWSYVVRFEFRRPKVAQADEGARFTLILVAWSGSWCMGRLLVID